MKRSDQGFTLAEMLVVLALLAVAATVSLPWLKGQQRNTELTQVTRKLSAGLAEARLAAISQNRESVLTFKENDRTFMLDGKRKIATLPQTASAELLTVKGNASDLSKDFRFFPDGSSTGGEIVLTSGSEKKSVKISWLTGQIVVEDQQTTP